MSFNGSGTFTTINTFVYDTVISETDVNTNFSDVATGLSTCITKDGQTTVSANIPMATYKFTGLGSGSAATDSANLGQVQAQAYTWCGTAGGTTNALTLSPSPAITAYAAGQSFRAIIGAANTDDAVTVAISGLTTKAVELNGAACSATSYLETGKIYQFDYDGTAFQATRLSSTLFAPGPIGGTTPSTGAFTQVTASGYNGAVGSVTPNSGAFTTITGAGTGITGIPQYTDSGTWSAIQTNTATPAFYATNSARDTNVTGDGTTFTVIFDSERFDQGSNFDATSTFTAPVTGKYRFDILISILGLTSSHTSSVGALVTSNATYRLQQCNPWGVFGVVDQFTYISQSVLVDMDASDTAYVTIQISGGTKVASVEGGSNQSWISGSKVA